MTDRSVVMMSRRGRRALEGMRVQMQGNALYGYGLTGPV